MGHQNHATGLRTAITKNWSSKWSTSLNNKEQYQFLLEQDLLIKEFIKKYPNIEHVVYDSISNSSALDAFEKSYGKRALADYDFSLANTIISELLILVYHSDMHHTISLLLHPDVRKVNNYSHLMLQNYFLQRG